MKLFCLSFILIVYGQLIAQVEYEKYFSDNQIRFNYTIYGNSIETHIESPIFYKEPRWNGSKLNLLDTFHYGEFLLKVFCVKSGNLIYSRGFSNLFIEWQLTSYAKDSVKHFNESIYIPMPREKVQIDLLKRDKQNNFQIIYSNSIDPKELNCPVDKTLKRKEKRVHYSGKSTQNLDVVFISEGYLGNQKKQFFNDAQRFKSYLFSSPVYHEYRDKINITAVFIPSEEEGVDIPKDSIYVQTLLGSHFGTFGIDRYLTLPDQSKIFSYLNGIPCEQVCVLVNSEKYGGGGIFNHYNVFTVNNIRSREVFLHEFGHGFASLADEYFNSKVPYEEEDSVMFEPYEPNVTALLDFDSKWSYMVLDSIPVPTPDNEGFEDVVGVFEGAKYRSKGYYRSERNCMMRSLEADGFCKVCTKAIQQMIMNYAK